MAIVDHNTGKEVSASGRTLQDYTQTAITAPIETTTQTTGTQQTSGSQTAASSSYAMNTTPTILNALESFITQMMDRPAISNAELDALYPLPIKSSAVTGKSNTGYVNQQMKGTESFWIDPKSGQQLSDAQAEALKNQRIRDRERAVQSSGIIKGGTEEQRAVSDARLEEIARNRETQGKYSKEAAMADAQALSSYFSRILSEQQMPGILRAAEGSGASQGTTRALLTQQAIQRNAENAAKVGIDAAVGYGGINNQLASTLELLTRQDPNSISNQLLEALGIGKGIVQSQVGVQNTQSSQTAKTNQTQVQNQGQQVQQTSRDVGGQTGGLGYTAATGYSEPAAQSANSWGYVEAHDPYSNIDFRSSYDQETGAFV